MNAASQKFSIKVNTRNFCYSFICLLCIFGIFIQFHFAKVYIHIAICKVQAIRPKGNAREHSLCLYDCNYSIIRIVQKQADSRLGKLLEKIRGKKEPISSVIKKEKRVHIKWKRRDPIKQMDTTVSLKNGGGHRFFLCNEENRIAFIKQKAIELYFPNGKNKYGEEAQNCTINIQDASGVLVNEDKLLSTFLKERGVYTTKFTLFYIHILRRSIQTF